MEKILVISFVIFVSLVLCEEIKTNISFSEFLPKENEKNGRWCQCINFTEIKDFSEIECRCFGLLLVRVPTNLPEIKKLTIMDAAIRVLKQNSFQPYKQTLEDVTLTNLQKLQVIEPGTFRNVDNLRSLYISHAPRLKILPMLFEKITTNKFLSLRIIHTGLEVIPDLSKLNQSKILHMIDLEGNKFDYIPSNSIKIQAEQVILNYNLITKVDSHAFFGSEIAKLSFKGNRQLSTLHKEAFSGLKSLIELDLSGTSIENMPVQGLDELEILRIQNTKSLKVIPSVYNFNRLKEAWLTHSFHCCAFKYPAQHDPIKHAMHEAKMKKLCQVFTDLEFNLNYSRVKRNIDTFWGNEIPEDKLLPTGDFWGIQPNESFLNESFEDFGRKVEDQNNLWHNVIVPDKKGILALCGNFSESINKILCYPEPDALNPCEDIMGSNWLRISVWFVLVTAVIGNLAVVIVFFSSLFDINVPKFLMCHLACADVCMGFYLLLIASMDLHSMGYYFNFAFDWQMGDGCKVAGFLTVFSSQLSVFTLTIITLERWFAIRYAIYLNRRIRLGAAAKIMTVGWIYSILMASLPLFGISNYSSTSICLPMEVQDPQDLGYLIALLMTNGLAFLIIVVCYSQIYLSLGQETRRCSSNSEMTIAKKMAMLVFTDFACWAPIAFFGLTALAGYPLIDVTRSKILLVFFYPLNSCANPYLYAILTAQYRRDFFLLIYRCGICKSRVRRYTTTTDVQNSNPSNPLPLLRINGRKMSRSTNFIDEQLV